MSGEDRTMSAMARVLVIDNYDSFVFNLVQYLGELGAEPLVYRNHALTADEALGPGGHGIVISPGPGRPEDAGITPELVSAAGRSGTPLLGVCLGHQAVGHVFGAEIVRADRIMHGKTSWVHHNSAGIFACVPDPFEATRYHSLVIRPDSVPDVLEVTAHTDDGTVMGVRHRDLP